MAEKKKPKKVALTDKGKKKRAAPRKKVDGGTKGLSPAEVAQGAASASTSKEAQALVAAIAEDGGAVLAVYADPIGGNPIVLAALPIDKVEPTPYQRDRSDAHLKKLARAMERVERYLDPIIAVRHDGMYWTPNGNHRLGAMRLLGMRTLVALVLPDEEIAYQILALNTEKAHNLKERSLEVIRMYRGLVGASPRDPESDYAAIFEEPHFATLGAAYEKRPRYSAGAYAPIVRRLENFVDEPLQNGLALRERRADRLLAFDDAVVAVVDALKERGLQSAYLKNYVVARVNFLRFKKSGDFEFDETIDKLEAAVKKIDPHGVKKEDITRMGGSASGDSDED